MPARVTERWNERTITRGRSARRVFDVDAGPTSETEAQDAVAATANGAPGVTYGTSHPLDPTLAVAPNGIDAVPIVPGYYRVTATYEGKGTTVGTEVFSKKWIVLPAEPLTDEVDADTTFDSAPVLNSSLQPYESPIKRRRQGFRIRIRRWEPLSGAGDLLQKSVLYSDRWINDAVTLPVWGPAAAKELYIENILAVQLQEQGSSNGMLVEYVFQARPYRTVSFEGGAPVIVPAFWTRILDQGTDALVKDGDQGAFYRRPIQRKGSNEQITEPVRLDGRGWPIDHQSYVIFKKDQKTVAALTDASNGPTFPASVVRETCVTGNQASVFLNFDTTSGGISGAGLNIAANM